MVTIIGLDGATFRLILPWVKEGKLLTLKKLMELGAWGELESTIHPLSPQAWASFMTGKNPGKHGIFEFVEHKPKSYALHYVNGGFIHGKKLWEFFSDVGKRVCIMNVPLTYPPDRVNGYLISGLDAPGIHSNFCYPSELLEELTKKFGEYQLRQHPYGATPRSFLKKIFSQFDYILKVAKYLKVKESWDLFMVVFESTDLVQHFYWHYAFPEKFDLTPVKDKDLDKAIFNVYQKIDQGLGELLNLCQTQETVIVMSDHGFSPCRKVVFMDRWLQQQGYLSYHEKNENRYKLTRFLHLAFQKYFPNRFKGLAVSQVPKLRDRFRSYLTTATIDWKRTKAFSLGIDSTNIFINLRGKFPDGIVDSRDEYDKLREEITHKLMNLKDPKTGEKIIEKVYKREELYHGENLSKAPDLLVIWKNFEYNTRRGYRKEKGDILGSSLDYSDVSSYSSLQKSGTHHIDGIFIAKGPNIKKKGSVHGIKIIDLAPTILYIMGEKIPEDMDGKILKEIIKNDFLSMHPIQSVSSKNLDKNGRSISYSQKEEEYIKEKLQGLGYID